MPTDAWGLLDFPSLPTPEPPVISWSAPVLSGYELVVSKYQHYRAMLQLDDGNLGRLRTCYHSIETDLLPLWSDLESSGLPIDVIEYGLDCLARLFVCLGESVAMLEERYVLK
jgi:hypothetical protein